MNCLTQLKHLCSNSYMNMQSASEKEVTWLVTWFKTDSKKQFIFKIIDSLINSSIIQKQTRSEYLECSRHMSIH